ncbi:MAG: TetR/AcrR family transcriptional regulator [Firmicutes bacterium]|nr:TetR/AcrR family transcriptional regulator [Bacillota bacterium]
MPRIIKKPEERKEELLQIGIRFFLQGGGKNVSIQKVVHEANVATGLFYYYFKTKEDFIEQALERYAYDYIIALEKIVGSKSVPVLERLDSLMKQLNSRFREVLKINDDALLNTPWHLALEELIIQRAHKTIAAFVQEGWESGHFRVSDPGITALYLLCGLMGVLLRADASNSDKAHEEIGRLVFYTLGLEQTRQRPNDEKAAPP